MPPRRPKAATPRDLVGDLDLSFEALELPADPGLRINICTADPETPSEDAWKSWLTDAVANIDAVVFTQGSSYGDASAAEAVDYGAAKNVLRALAGQRVRIALMTAIGVTRRGSTHDWKRRSERLVRASGNAYTIVPTGSTTTTTTNWKSHCSRATPATQEGQQTASLPATKSGCQD